MSTAELAFSIAAFLMCLAVLVAAWGMQDTTPEAPYPGRHQATGRHHAIQSGAHQHE